jgi:hypothetical protein
LADAWRSLTLQTAIQMNHIGNRIVLRLHRQQVLLVEHRQETSPIRSCGVAVGIRQ